MDEVWETAVRSGDAATVRRCLDAGADPDARDRHGQTGLMVAAHEGHVDVVEALIAAGAALDVTAKYTLTALMLAIVAGHEEVARTIARAGADVTVQGSGAPGFAGRTAYDLAQGRGLDRLADGLRPR